MRNPVRLLARHAAGAARAPRIVVASCAAVREGLSARLDAEVGPLPAATIARHLERCPSCGEFSALIGDLNASLGLSRGARREVAGSDVGIAETALVLSRWRRRPVDVAAWAAVIVPIGLAIPVALGAFAHVHIDPSHALTPCTEHLQRYLAR